MQIKLNYFRLILCLLFPAAVFAQQNSVSPYSYYGLGDITLKGYARNDAMGGLFSAVRSPFNINYQNPASYTALQYTAFEVGVNGSLTRLEQNDLTTEENNTTLSYLAFGFPISDKIAVTAGLTPYSAVGYNITIQESFATIDDTVIDYQTIYRGSGGLNRFHLGVGVSPFENFSIGLNMNYLFGTLDRVRDQVFEDEDDVLNRRDVQSLNIKDVQFTFGMQYQYDLDESRAILVGATMSPATNLDATQDNFTHTYDILFEEERVRDTIARTTTEGKFQMPLDGSFGISYIKKDKLLVGLDYQFQNWGDVDEFFGGTVQGLDNSSRIALGGAYTPEKANLHKFWKKVEYRAGFRYTSGYLKIAGDSGSSPERIDEIGITFGLGLPMRKALSSCNIGFELGQRGTNSNNLIREQFLRFNLSPNLKR